HRFSDAKRPIVICLHHPGLTRALRSAQIAHLGPGRAATFAGSPRRGGFRNSHMTTLTGIIQWPQAAEARVRRLEGGRIVLDDNDPLVPEDIRQQYPLRAGLMVTVEVGQRKKRRRGKGGGTRTVVESLVAIEGGPPADYAEKPPFEDLTSIDPQPRISLEYPGCPAACRLIDL